MGRELSARSPDVNTASANQSTEASTLTLGELLYADPTITCVPEKDWVAIVRAIAGGDESALRVLFDKTYPIVLPYVMRLTGDRRITDNVILEVFQDVWCEAPVFDGTNGPVLGWIMGQARSSALAHAGSAEPMARSTDRVVATLLNDPIDAHANVHSTPDDPKLQVALAVLEVEEREAIEAAFLNGLSYAEAAAKCGETIGTIKRRIRSGLLKLQRTLQVQGNQT